MPRSAGTELALLPFVIEKGAPTMKSIAILLAIVFTCAATPLTAQNPNIIVDTAMTAKIRAEATSGASQVSAVFDTLPIDIGPRLTNSLAYYRAVDFVTDKLKSWGLDTHREPWKFGRGWTLERAGGHMPSYESSMQNLEKAQAKWRPPRTWRSGEESLMIRRYVFQWLTCRDPSRPSGRAWTSELGISHTWLQKLVREFQTDPSQMWRLQESSGDP